MGITAATLAGHRATDASAQIPAWGAWYADVSIDDETALTGAVDLVIADLTLKGTILSGGPMQGRASYRLVGGKAGWGKVLPKKSYSNDGGVRMSTILLDAANEAGETLDATTLPTDIVGPSWTRQADAACRVLEQLAPSAWYVGEDGITRLGKRPTAQISGTVTQTSQIDLARGTVTIATESIATVVPGIVVKGLEAVDVFHEISSKGGLRSTIWAKRGSGASRRLEAFRKIFDQLDPDRAFRGLWEYRVVTQESNRVNLQPVRVSTGMPDLRRVFVRPGVPGSKAMLTLGARVIVGFADANPAWPVVVAFEDADGEGFKSISLTIDATTTIGLGAGARPVAATGDLAGGIWPIVSGQAKVLV